VGEILFHGVQVKPVNRRFFAMLEGKPLMGMPGYPLLLINSYLFLIPPSGKWHGYRPAKAIPSKPNFPAGFRQHRRRQFLTVKLVGDERCRIQGIRGNYQHRRGRRLHRNPENMTAGKAIS